MRQDGFGLGAIEAERLVQYGVLHRPAGLYFGSESRTDPNLRAAGINNFDFAVFNTGITERFNVQFRTEIFNLFNRVQFSPPNTTLARISH